MYIIKTSGYVLSKKEEYLLHVRKNAGLSSIQGHKYYVVITNAGACDECLAQSGAVYPVAAANPGVNLPPFHPNCKCGVTPFTTSNQFEDPVLDELIAWVEATYESSSKEEQMRRIIGYYGLGEEYSEEFLFRLLRATEDTQNISQRISEFWRLFELAKEPVTITPEQLREFGWANTTQEEADRLNAAFAKYGVSTWESVREFMALAMAESGGGLDSLENGSDAYFEEKPYDKNERGAGYIQVTGRTAHLEFLATMGDDYDGPNTAEYIAEHYPLEASVWYWVNRDPYDGGINEFIETRQAKEDDIMLSFIKSAYYTAGFPQYRDESGKLVVFPNFNDDINDPIAGKVQYTITDGELIIRGTHYPLPGRWTERLEAYEKAQEIW